ncbi:hypothetical protein KDI_26270 [Dictyobacter arantiisoli]|uniref:Uncharacterized protein n=1 Tax=Dictyobacter arantiisoli TaxID=2014874 RepID=A0A5A5TDE1_9CHLR|nr:hypothetical protein KDI_26270 [Dictyobacter arantiisoli]
MKKHWSLRTHVAATLPERVESDTHLVPKTRLRALKARVTGLHLTMVHVARLTPPQNGGCYVGFQFLLYV